MPKPQFVSYKKGLFGTFDHQCITPTFLATLINKMHSTESKMFVTPKTSKSRMDEEGHEKSERPSNI